MKVGDLVRSQHAEGINVSIFLGEEFPWNDTFGLIGESRPFPNGTLGIYLDQFIIQPNNLHGKNTLSPKIFYKILTIDGKVGWLYHSWVCKV